MFDQVSTLDGGLENSSCGITWGLGKRDEKRRGGVVSAKNAEDEYMLEGY